MKNPLNSCCAFYDKHTVQYGVDAIYIIAGEIALLATNRKKRCVWPLVVLEPKKQDQK